MDFTKHSRNRFLDSLSHWHISRDYADPIYNYVAYGFEPGGFFTSVFANDFLGAMGRSHPANSVEELKQISGWILNSCPQQAWGSYKKVSDWVNMDPKRRRRLLEEWKLVHSEEEEIMLALRNAHTAEPLFY